MQHQRPDLDDLLYQRKRLLDSKIELLRLRISNSDFVLLSDFYSKRIIQIDGSIRRVLRSNIAKSKRIFSDGRMNHHAVHH